MRRDPTNQPFPPTKEVNSSTSTTARALVVAEAIGLYGPLTLNQLASLVQIHRSSVWRIIATLKLHGWVRMRPGDNAFELTSRLDMQFANFHFAPADVESAANVIKKVLKEGVFHANLYQFVAPGQCILVESTFQSIERDGCKSMIMDAPALAAQLNMSSIERKRHMKAFWPIASLEEQEIVLSGEHDDSLNNYRQKKVVWSSNELAASISWKGDSCAPGAITVVAKKQTKKSEERLRSFVPSLLSYLEGLK